MSKKLVLVLFVFTVYGVLAQELPPVVNYGPSQYSAGNQNWMIDQAENKNLYFANSTGLLEYNGEKWNLYPVPNNTIVRSLKVVGERIYTGAYMEAGYWEKNEFGSLEYTSLVGKFNGAIGEGEQFWDIEFIDELVIFRSFGGVYFYNPQQDSITKMPNPLGKPVSGIFKVEKELYFQLVGEGLYVIRNGSPVEVIPYEKLGDTAIMHIYNEAGVLSFISGKTEFYKWQDQDLSKEVKPVNTQIGYPNILDAINLPSGDIVLGTVGNGVVEIDSKGNIVNAFNQQNILLNNTVLDLFMDKDQNLWAGLDYGISSIDLKSSFKSFQDNRGEIGSVYASYEEDGTLYLGTNQGLYVRNKGGNKFNLIEGTNGQVWFVDEVAGDILCGQDSGTFLIKGDKATKICDRLGTWTVKEFNEDILIQGHYNGISFLRKNGNELEPLPMLEDFPHSSKFIEIDGEQNLWISNEHKGVYKILLEEPFQKVTTIKNYKFPGESGITSSLFQFNDSLYYSSKEKIYHYSSIEDSFIEENSLNALISDLNRVSGRMISEEDQSKLWGFAQEGIFSIQNSILSKDYSLEFVFIDQDFRNIAVGYENISNFGDEEYLLGIANGYLKFSDPGEIVLQASVNLDKIEVSALDSPANSIQLDEAGSFDFKNNNISFNYSAPVHDKYLDAKYSYRLIGLSPNWSSWSSSPEVNFKNLDFGNYTFEVKAKVGDTVTESVSYQFKIQRPYYFSIPAIIGYFIVFLLILYLIHLLNKRHHRKNLAENERALKMRNLEAEQEIIKLRNEKLEQDMANKNRELAVSTMSLIKKNEFLTSIKDELKKSESSSKVKSVINTIDKDISEEDNWKFFKKAFSNADKDFFKKIKAVHPELTSNDLKLCAYLRLNLSSKEIAPLLNISVKSVEIKRYRLRKKMDLDRETNLTEYILDL